MLIAGVAAAGAAPSAILVTGTAGLVAGAMSMAAGEYVSVSSQGDAEKADIAREAERLGLDSAWSWSCYDPAPDGSACGLCDSCRLRRKGFADAGLTDRVAYFGDRPNNLGEGF